MRAGGGALLALVLASSAGAAGAVGGMQVVLGKALFERLWVPAPASTDAADGLGPLFNARSCTGCHAAGGGAEVSEAERKFRGFAARFGDSEGNPHPVLGLQLQDRAVPGLAAEGQLEMDRNAARPSLVMHVTGVGGDASPVSIRQAPPLFGRGALETISDASILARADPDDRDGDGISGRANLVDTLEGTRVARYGWKARNADLESQVAEAFELDLGLSSPLRPQPHGDCTGAQAECLAAPSGASAAFDGQELSAEMVRLVRDYVASLAARPAGPPPPAFAAAGCGACHVPEMADAAGEPVPAFTDLLLHDMGPGLDDHVGEPGVASSEWRTAPLAALAPAEGRRRYLHDGRAASLDAAIRAHGGEAEGARLGYESLDAGARRALLAYLESL